RVGGPGRQRGGLAEVLPETYEADATVSRSDLLQPLPRAIRRAGVDIDHVVPAPHRLKRVAETSVERLEVVLLVQDGKDDREGRRVVLTHRCPSDGSV